MTMLTRTASIRILALVLVLLSSAWLLATPVVAEVGIVADSIASTPYGTYNGIEFVKHTGRFVGLASEEYSVPFEVIAPADPAQGNGAVLVETLHIMGGANARDAYLGPEFLFGRGFTHAAIGWHPDDVNPFEGYVREEAIQIIASFAQALRQDAALAEMVGDVQQLYVTGVSKATEPLLALMHSELGKDLFYRFGLAEAAGLEVALAAEFDGVVALLTGDDCDNLATVACGDSVDVAALQPGTYYLVVEGLGADEEGPFTMTVRLVE